MPPLLSTLGPPRAGLLCFFPSAARPWCQSVRTQPRFQRAEVMTPIPPAHRKVFLEPQTRADAEKGTSVGLNRHILTSRDGEDKHRGSHRPLRREDADFFLWVGVLTGGALSSSDRGSFQEPSRAGRRVSPDPAILNMAEGLRTRDPGPHIRLLLASLHLWARGPLWGSGMG